MLATDSSAEAIALVEINARANEVRLETAKVDWSNPDGLLKRGKCDLVLAADVLYERASVGQLLALLPRLAPEVWLADPGRSGSEEFLEMARGRWSIDTGARGLISVHRLRLHGSLGAIS